jgi:hypothetical protein
LPVKRSKNEANLVLEQHLDELGFDYQSEYCFYDPRKWRFDYVILSCHFVAIEIEGGVWSRGRHTRGKGFIDDMEKYNIAAGLGWKVFRFSTQQVLTGDAKKFLQQWAD